MTFAVSGAVIQNWPAGLFVLPAAAHLLSAILLWVRPSIDSDTETISKAHVPPEPALIAQRTLALWLARIALPATYVVVFSLSAMLPSLAVMQSLSTTAQTAVGSVWMMARLLAFVALGATAWWHTRPRILLAAAVVMLAAFWGVTIPLSSHASVALTAMIFWQIILGVVMGIIYAGSLYFGMVLSEGSTEHGGYHEALIGLGSVIGPGTAALTQWRHPGDLTAGVIAVSGVIGISILAAGMAMIAAAKRPTR